MKPDEGTVARRYARAAMLYCDSHGGHEQFAGGMATIIKALEVSPLFESLLTTPLLGRARKRKLVYGVGKALHVPEAVLKFLGILVDKARIEHLGPIHDKFDELLDEKLGRVKATVYTAVPVDEQMKVSISTVLSQFFSRRVLCSFHIDESLYGGVLARVGNTVIDSSLKGKLAQVRERISTLTS